MATTYVTSCWETEDNLESIRVECVVIVGVRTHYGHAGDLELTCWGPSVATCNKVELGQLIDGLDGSSANRGSSCTEFGGRTKT